MGKIIKNGIVYGGGGGGSGSGHTIMDTNGNFMPAENNLQFIGLDVTDNSSDGITEVESATLNQDSLDDIMSAGTAGNQVAGNGLVYSTTEQIVGKWIDGKPLYQKTVVVNPTKDYTANTKTLDELFTKSTLDKMVDLTGTIEWANGNHTIRALPCASSYGQTYQFIPAWNSTDKKMSMQIVLNGGSHYVPSELEFVFHLRYTKTS